MKITLIGLSDELYSAAQEVSEQLNIELCDNGQIILCEQVMKAITVSYDGKKTVIKYGNKKWFIRALGITIEGLRKGKPFEIAEQSAYENLSIMIDCSRNAVLHMQSYKRIIRTLALMGYTSVQLYTEDTFEVAEHPYFGYLRGRFTTKQLQEMDAFAAKLGIELVPCIQTLAHLGALLKWQAAAHLKDVNDILLIDEPKVYELIDQMFSTMASSMKSRRINIGMDEAHMMGLGKYLDQHGYHDRSSLMIKHFNRVIELARKYGFKPMMWSDMFFRLASGGQYYDPNSPIKQEIIELIPDDVSLVYWDYYSENLETYQQMMKKHKQLNDNIIFAGGAWKWMGFAPNNHFSNFISKLAHESCKENGIKEVLITSWGDDGAESSLFHVLPALQQWAELCYRDEAGLETIEERFATCTNGNYNDFMLLDALHLVPDNPAPGKLVGNQANPGKYVLYQDVLYGLFDRHISRDLYVEHYGASTSLLTQAAARNEAWSYLFDTQAALCSVLEIKSAAGIDIRSAYQAKDQATLTKYANVILPDLIDRIRMFITLYRKQWQLENKIFGLDVFDLRMGGLIQRVETAIYRINQYIHGDLEQLEELEEDILFYDGRNEDEHKLVSVSQWHQIVSPSVITGI